MRMDEPAPASNEPPHPAARRAWRAVLLGGLLPVNRATLARDIVAGLTLAALAIPEVMGYTRIAGTPVVTGLYTLMVPALAFAVLGSSRLLVVGADSATAAIMAAALAPLAQPGSGEWMLYAQAMALACAVLLLLARVARLGFLADFLSRTVLVGFLTGVGLQVAIGELPTLLGVAAHGHHPVELLAQVLRRITATQPAELALGGATLAGLLLMRRWLPRFPAALVAVVAATGASLLLDWGSHHIAVVGALQGGLPSLALPDLSLLGREGTQLAPAVLAMTVVILAQSAATSRAYAWKYNTPFDENHDLVGLAAANAGAALTGTFVVNGSPTKTQMVDSAGGRSQAAHLTMAAVVTLVVLFATGPIAALPRSVLAAIVFLIGIDLVHVQALRRIRAERPSEFWVALITAAAVLVVGVEQAIVLAMVLSLIDHVRRGYKPHNSVIVRGEDGHAQLADVATAGEYAPGLMVYRFSHAMYYANAEVLSQEVNRLVGAARPGLSWFVIDLDAVDDVDYSAGATLASLAEQLQRRGISLMFMRPSRSVLALLERYGIVAPGTAGAQVFRSVREMRHAFTGTARDDAKGNAG
ncbi:MULTISPECIES: SulP family inorganic anion transporter [Ramlibacter]|uniref:SulP family inorganic anion transporter n=1 Tax=Ramlibacter aquaticus TaxID=2780094 RepID=A0ABR9SIT1_9BURK|nr:MULTISPECIES: SulP family inorganic anion transporter [Ramlibacter]MBE7942170.1 SulP family inorganic anion transporter [Ramlibacter aquaticus]